MAAFLEIIGGIKGIIVIIVFVAVGAWAYTQKRNYDKAILERDTAISQRDTAGAERDKAILAAKTNADTIARLEQDKLDINFALNKLAEAKETSRKNTVTREVIIQNQATIPANAAVVAPVIGTIINEIQNDRVRRRGQ